MLLLTDYTLFRLYTYGLETGVYLCAMAMCVASTERIVRKGWTSWAETAVLGIAGLARIDFGLMFVCVLVSMLVKRWIGVANAL